MRGRCHCFPATGVRVEPDYRARLTRDITEITLMEPQTEIYKGSLQIPSSSRF
jgi:hypothetical protein